MRLLYYLLASSWLIDVLVLVVPGLWRIRKISLAVGTVLGVAAAYGLLIDIPNAFSGLLALVSLYRLFNYFRVLEARMHEAYLRRAVRRSGLTLAGVQLLLAGG